MLTRRSLLASAFAASLPGKAFGDDCFDESLPLLKEQEIWTKSRHVPPGLANGQVYWR